jgi:hypothetical protein
MLFRSLMTRDASECFLREQRSRFPHCGSYGKIVIIVTDPGPGFSPDLLSDPKKNENLYVLPRKWRLPDPVGEMPAAFNAVSYSEQ